MKRTAVFTAAYLVFSVAAVPLRAADGNPAETGSGNSGCPYRRIVSLSPSVTEILFDLGLGDRIIGVTRYCRYPEAAREKTRVGGYYDPNYEQIVRLRPDLVVLLTVHATAAERLRQVGLNLLTVDPTSISGIVASIMTIGNACGALPRAQELVSEINGTMNRIREKTDGRSRPRVLMCVDRNMDALRSVYIAGKDAFYDEMISCAGGVNVYTGPALRYPVVSIEGILQLDPDIIIDLVPDSGEEENRSEKIAAQWNTIASLSAVRNRRVYLFRQDYAVIPGPRFIELLESLARVIHSELDWK